MSETLRILSEEQFDDAVQKSIDPLIHAMEEVGEDNHNFFILMIVAAFAGHLRSRIFRKEESFEGSDKKKDAPTSAGTD